MSGIEVMEDMEVMDVIKVRDNIALSCIGAANIGLSILSIH